MCLCGFNCEAFRVECCLALCSRVVLFSIVITSFGEERAGLCAFRAFVVYFACLNVCPFSLPLGIGCGLRLWHSLDFSINCLE